MPTIHLTPTPSDPNPTRLYQMKDPLHQNTAALFVRDLPLLLLVLHLLGDLPHLLLADVVPDAVHGRVATQLAQVTAREAVRLLSDLLQVDGVAQLDSDRETQRRGANHTL